MYGSTHKGFYRLSTGLLLGCAIAVAGYFIVFNAARQEDRDHTRLLISILKLEATRSPAIVITKEPPAVLTKSFKDLEMYLADQEWQLVEQFGGTVFYQKNATGKQLSASCGMYSGFYMICNLYALP